MKMVIKVVLIVLFLLVVVYFLGPRVARPKLTMKLPKVSVNLVELQEKINQKEAANFKIKPNNESKIIWHDSIPKKTKYAIVYLHGWSASHEEGAPLHQQLGERYGANVYLPRLAGHGLIEDEPMLNLTATELLDSAKEAFAVATQLGDKVIVMGTSTGGTLALRLASWQTNIAALLLYSPNIELYDSSAKLLSGPWGVELAKIITGDDYYQYEADSIKQNYWTTKYRLEALAELQVLMDETMQPETFAKVKQPTFLGYYYKSEEEQDKVVSVDALLEMYAQLGVDKKLKRLVAFSEVEAHVMTSYITSKDIESVQQETIAFLEEVVKLKPIQ
jgi:esterase/lipase